MRGSLSHRRHRRRNARQAGRPRAPGVRNSPVETGRARPAGGRLLLGAVVSAIVLGGIAAAAVTQRDLAREARQREELVADQTANLADAMVQEVLAGLGGAHGLADAQGNVEEAPFRAFAAGATRESSVSSVAYAATVPATERADVEDDLGQPIVDAPGGPPAPERRTYHPVRWAAPPDDPNATPIGLDVEADAVLGPTAQAARDADRALASEPFSQRAGHAVAVVQPVYHSDLPSDASVDQRRRALVGYVSATLPGDELLAILLSRVEDRIDLRVTDGDDLVAETAEPPNDGSSISRDIAGRSWTVTVEDRRSLASAAPWWILAATAAVAVAVTALGRRTGRHEQETAGYIRRSDSIAALARSLAAAGSVPELARVVDDEVPDVVGSASVTFGLVDWDERRVERFFGPGAPGPEFARRYAVVDIDARIPVARCVREGEPVVVETLNDWRAESSPDVARDVELAGIGTTVCWPIRDPADTVVATLSVSWEREGGVAAPTLAALRTIAELVELTLARVRLTDAQVADARLDAELAMLTSGLAAVGTADDAMAFLGEQLPRPLEAVHATVGLVEPGGVLRRHIGPGVESRSQDGFAVTDLDAPLPLPEAVRTGTTIVIASTDVLAEHWPAALEGWKASGFRSAADIALHGRDGRVVGGLGVAWDREVTFDDDLMTRLTTLAGIVAQALERARLFDATRREATRTARLAELAEAATAAGTTEHMAVTLASRAAAVVDGAGGHVGLLTSDQRALRVIHHDRFDRSIGRRYAFQRLDEPLPLVDAVTTGEPVLLESLGDIAARTPVVYDDMVALGLEALAVMPMSTEEGVAFGALAIAWSHPQTFDRNLLSTLRTVTDLCTTSLTRAWLTDRTAARTAALATLARHLSVARSFNDVTTAIADHAAPALEAQATILGLLEGDRLHLGIPDTVPGDLAAKYTDLPLDDDFPALEALRRNEVVTFGSPNDVPPHDVVRELVDLGISAGACAPLAAADGSPLGVLSVVWTRPPTFNDALLERLDTVADLAAQTAERARLFDAEHRITQDLQRRVLPRMPSVDGLVIAARYEPASVGVGMGGDWYDGVVLDDDRVCIVLGDVSGHGLGAIAEMTQIRAMVRTFAASGAALSEVVARTSAQISDEDGVYATLVVVTVDTRTGSLGYVTAGHPPPLLRRPDGTVQVLRHGRHPVLGVDLGPRPAGCVEFPPGSTLVAYTDGLIERPGTPIDVSIDELAEQVAGEPDMTPEDLADHLVRLNPTGADHPDDLALVVVHRR
jgi:GAF domain-containing protein/CHASE1-domain containing sensor protein